MRRDTGCTRRIRMRGAHPMLTIEAEAVNMQTQAGHGALEHLFGAHLYQDWPDEYESIDEAPAAYREGTGAPLREQAAVELDAALAEGLPCDPSA